MKVLDAAPTVVLDDIASSDEDSKPVASIPRMPSRKELLDFQSPDVPVMHHADFDALADRCINLLEHSRSKDHAASSCKSFNVHDQIFIAVAGTPGSGKSFIAERVADRINERSVEEELAVVIPMDGYHKTRKQLRQMAEDQVPVKSDVWTADDEPGVASERVLTYEQLLGRRGAAFTYNPKKFIRDLEDAKRDGEGSFPIYSREKHDPVPNGAQLKNHHKIILVEGLYVLCHDDPDWAPLASLWDDQWYVHVSLPETRRRLIKRHLEHWDEGKTKHWGGSDEAAAARKADSNDLLNAKCIMKHTKPFAKLIVKNEHIPGQSSSDDAEEKKDE